MISEYLTAGAGILVAVIPLLGFPNSWDKVILFLIGVSIFYLAFRIKRRNPSVKPRLARKKASTFADNRPTSQNTPPSPSEVLPQAEIKKPVRRIHPVKEEPVSASPDSTPSVS